MPPAITQAMVAKAVDVVDSFMQDWELAQLSRQQQAYLLDVWFNMINY